MAILTTNANTITGSATNTLGTLGRSIFNSTVGVFADKDTMDQLYGVMDKLSSSIETIDKTFDVDAFNGRNKADDLYSLLAGLDIKSSSDFMNKNREFMKRLMRLNKQEKDITLNAIGVDTTGHSDVVRNEYVRDYNHVQGNNYYEEYVKPLKRNQEIGDETTKMQLESSTHFNYSGLHNDLYVVTQNLYPDDENKGTFANKWIVENRNSLMYKTKKLFNSKKIGTIISRFHTDPYGGTSALDNARSKYGLSHGRNLLKSQAERGYNSSYVSGYDNPYCRVWTHHHQYDRYYKTIRPFSQVDDQGNYVDTISVQDFHQWGQFADSKDNTTPGEWGWKKDANNGWQYSVLQDNGLVNITPKYVTGEATNIHTKQCMFSIENLAWRGYDPYSFEQALSWEQRGPLGGRIMWFPPYGIQFNETTTTQWTNNTFLGRGEDVYTYANTTRTGTLSFMMVVDHPSILDYVSWTNANKNVTDTDILRFLAGCGEGDGNGLRDLAKPTPLTDEYTQQLVHETVVAKEDEEGEEQKQQEAAVEEYIEPDDTKPIDNVLCFYVFYPNNYSGTYDDPYGSGGEGYKIDQGSRVEAIPYLLGGVGAQKESGEFSGGTFAEDIQLNKANNYEGATGSGYEMGGSGLGTAGGYISGTSLYHNVKGKNGRRYWTNLGSNGQPRTASYRTGTQNPKNCKKWYYRIDGRYAFPSSTAEEKIHYYNQTLSPQSAYVDDTCFGLNKNIEKLSSIFNDQIKKDEEGVYRLVENDNSRVYTLAEIAYVLYENKSTLLQAKCGITDEERIKYLKEVLSEENIKNIKSITAEGYASAHGYVETNKELGKNRAHTAANWFIDTLNLSITPQVTFKSDGNNIGTKDETDIDNKELEWIQATNGGEDKLNAKKWRYAKVVIELTNVGKKAVTEATYDVKAADEEKDNGTTDETTTDGKVMTDEEHKKKKEVVDNKGGKKYVGYNPTGKKGQYKGIDRDIYSDSKGKEWYLVYDANENISKFISVETAYAKEQDTLPKARYGGGKSDENRVRYDQEYHFFKVLKQTDPVVYGNLMDKLQYFDPAFHSMTPEGFNGRLTFLQQCMRQGNTVSASDGKFAKSANNLAFGRAPYCVLRLGDFYNQMIVIDNLSINYDPLVWDLNVEGIGVQPLIAHVQLSFKFVGGGDLTGPVRRLQNAMSFNYYANARLYDNRADRIDRRWSDKTCGALEHDEIFDESGRDDKMANTYELQKNGKIKQGSTFYSTKMYK